MPISRIKEPSLNRIKCTACGLVNFSTSEVCRRCEAPLADEASMSPALQSDVPPELHSSEGGRSFGRWLVWIASVTITILASAYASLILTSEGLTSDERQTVKNAIVVLERAGFTSDASALSRLATFRRTDNWWNRYVGHQTAFAATNYPFAVVTLYPAFFRFPVDDIERASILLHEASHLFGGREEEALQRVWESKQRLGWTEARYSGTRVWKNTREWTKGAIPAFFSCGPDNQSDCFE